MFVAKQELKPSRTFVRSVRYCFKFRFKLVRQTREGLVQVGIECAIRQQWSPVEIQNSQDGGTRSAGEYPAVSKWV